MSGDVTVIRRYNPAIAIKKEAATLIRKTGNSTIVRLNPPSSATFRGGPNFDDARNFVWRF